MIGRNDKGAVMPLIKYTLKNVVLSSVSIGGGGGDKPVETITLNYNHITWDFHSEGRGCGAGPRRYQVDLAKNVNA